MSRFSLDKSAAETLFAGALVNHATCYEVSYNGANFMAIAIGQQLGSYEITGLLGKGGMGVVYRARDTKLNRPVAIKLLSDDLADAAARRRFQREAQMASSLNHPHILTVLDVGEFEGCQYLVT